MYTNWKESDHYKQFILDNNGETELSEKLFASVKCDCISNEKQNECADHITVQFNMFIQGYRKLRKLLLEARRNLPCPCEACKNPKFRKCSESVQCFFDLLLCPKKDYKELSSMNDCTTLRDIQTTLHKITQREFIQLSFHQQIQPRTKFSFCFISIISKEDNRQQQ